MEDKKTLIKEKIELLNRAARAYYQDADAHKMDRPEIIGEADVGSPVIIAQIVVE